MPNWKDIHPNFTEELVQSWQSLGFSYQQIQEWISTGLQPTDYNFCAWLRDEVKITPIELLNDSSRIENLREQFKEYQQTQIEEIAVQQQPPK